MVKVQRLQGSLRSTEKRVIWLERLRRHICLNIMKKSALTANWPVTMHFVAFEQIEAARGEISLTPFEYHTLAALLIFKAHPLDVMILEVGLGGRLDAVNIIDADVAIVTSIAIDHTEWLGDTREQIACEKAGIFRAKRPAICGDRFPPNSLIAAAERLGAPLYV